MQIRLFVKNLRKKCSCALISGTFSPWHGASSGCEWRNGLQ